jgi:DNA-binding MarR family transcriptional regulator
VRTGDLLIGLHNAHAWAKYRLSASAKQALAILDGAGMPLEPGVIADRLLITSGSMTSLLDTLEKRGYLRRGPHPVDRRKVLVEITDAGSNIVDAMLPAIHARERTVLADALDRREQAELLQLLAKVQASALAHASDETDHNAVRRRPDRLARPSS